MSEILKVSNLSFNWGENKVLEDISFSIKSNELIAVLGINGAGKSTLIKCINRILKYPSGDIELLGMPILNVNLIELARQISYVPQSVRTSFPMEVFDVVLLGRRPHISWKISPEDREKVSQTLRNLGLEDFAFRRFDKLSGGERQRVIIAKAIAQDPTIYLFDEPTSDLDLKNQIEVMKQIRNIISNTENNKSALIAIHDINLAARFADKIILLHDGIIKDFGTPEQVLIKPNIEEVFSVTCEVIAATKKTPLRIYANDEISQARQEEE